jgi:hypothetical protein
MELGAAHGIPAIAGLLIQLGRPAMILRHSQTLGVQIAQPGAAPGVPAIAGLLIQVPRPAIVLRYLQATFIQEAQIFTPPAASAVICFQVKRRLLSSPVSRIRDGRSQYRGFADGTVCCLIP